MDNASGRERVDANLKVVPFSHEVFYKCHSLMVETCCRAPRSRCRLGHEAKGWNGSEHLIATTLS
jgi:hypothetical protein